MAQRSLTLAERTYMKLLGYNEEPCGMPQLEDHNDYHYYSGEKNAPIFIDELTVNKLLMAIV